jgi:hypothetical protein
MTAIRPYATVCTWSVHTPQPGFIRKLLHIDVQEWLGD